MKRIESSFPIALSENPEAMVLLTTTAGNGALAGGNLKLNQQVLKKGMLTNFPLGTVAEVRGQTYVVRTNGLDVNPATNVIPVTHVFSSSAIANNRATFEFPEDRHTEVDPADGLISYIISYTFE